MRISAIVGALLSSAIANCLGAGQSADSVSDPVRAQRQVRSFERSLAEMGVRGRLRCSEIIELVQDSPDYSFGAICELASGTSRKTIMLCDDTMIGKFTVKTSGFATDRESLVAFTRANCPGGG